jgi:hypothetical protein
MSRMTLISCLLIVGLTSIAQAKTFRVLKGQQRDIARFERAISRGAMHPTVKAKVLRTIAAAQKAVTKSKADYKRVHTRVTKYGGTLVFKPAWGREVTMRYYTQNGNSSAKDVAIFHNSKRSSWTFKAQANSPKLTTVYRGRLAGGHANPGRETSSYRLHTQNRQRSTALTTKLGELLLRGGNYTLQNRQLVSQLEPLMASSAPKGLKVTRGGNVKALDLAPPVTVEHNTY